MATKGLVGFGGKLHLFATGPVDGLDTDLFVVNILAHPTDNTVALAEIHFAEPYLGFLYVVAEFADGIIAHYWLQDAPEWEASKAYSVNDLVRPSVDNGFVYRATRLGQPYPSWTADTPRQLGDIIEPTVYNGFYYEVIAVQGDTPRSGDLEPDWPLEDGARVSEDAARATEVPIGAGQPPAPPSSSTPQTGTIDRYSDPLTQNQLK